MSTRVAKVSSLVKQTVATQLREELAGDAAALTVTSVEVTPDLRHAIVWIGVLVGNEQQQTALFKRVEGLRPALQAAVSAKLETKFVPRIELRPDASGAYADKMSRLIKGLE